MFQGHCETTTAVNAARLLKFGKHPVSQGAFASGLDIYIGGENGDHKVPRRYSVRRASDRSMDTARRAGSRLANNVTMTMVNATAIYAPGLLGDIP
jgi:hypothetical protein